MSRFQIVHCRQRQFNQVPLSFFATDSSARLGRVISFFLAAFTPRERVRRHYLSSVTIFHSWLLALSSAFCWIALPSWSRSRTCPLCFALKRTCSPSPTLAQRWLSLPSDLSSHWMTEAPSSVDSDSTSMTLPLLRLVNLK